MAIVSLIFGVLAVIATAYFLFGNAKIRRNDKRLRYVCSNTSNHFIMAIQPCCRIIRRTINTFIYQNPYWSFLLVYSPCCYLELGKSDIPKQTSKHSSSAGQRYPLSSTSPQAFLLVCKMRENIRIWDLRDFGAFTTTWGSDQWSQKSRICT